MRSQDCALKSVREIRSRSEHRLRLQCLLALRTKAAQIHRAGFWRNDLSTIPDSHIDPQFCRCLIAKTKSREKRRQESGASTRSIRTWARILSPLTHEDRQPI